MRQLGFLFMTLISIPAMLFFSFGQASQEIKEGTIFRVKVKQVGLSLTISDMTEAEINKLKKENIRVWEKLKDENGKEKIEEQNIVNFAVFKDQPIALAIVIDSSESMYPALQVLQGPYAKLGSNKLLRARVGAKDLVTNIFRDIDTGLIAELFMEVVNKEVRYVYIDQDWTKDSNKLLKGIGNVNLALGATPTRQAIYLLADKFLDKKLDKNYLRILVVVSDGGESKGMVGRLSALSVERVINKLQNNQILVYSIGLYDKKDGKILGVFGKEILGKGEPDILESAAYASGGKAFFVKDLGKLPKIFTEIQNAIRNIVYLGYTPKSDNDGLREIIAELGQKDGAGKWHKSKGRSIFHRRGYTYKKVE